MNGKRAKTCIDTSEEPLLKKRCLVQPMKPLKLYKRTKMLLRNDSNELIGRDKERKQIKEFWKKCITTKKSESMYISGAPGCGKTALLHELHSYFQSYEVKHNISPSTVLYINCMQLQTPESLFKYICEALDIKGVIKHSNYEQLLRKYLSAQKNKLNSSSRKQQNVRRRKTTNRSKKENIQPNYTNQQNGMIILIADEIDRLKTSDNHVLYSLFELSALKNSNLILFTIANALDMTDRILPRLLNSFCEPTTLHFTPYSALQISSIIKARLINVPDVIEDDAIDFCAGKVSSQSADVRSALEIMRSAVQLVQDQYEDIMEESNSDDIPLKKIEIIHVNRACKPSSPIIKIIQGLPQQQKYVLCSLTKLCLKGIVKPSILQIMNECKSIPFAKSMRKEDIISMISQLRENGIVANKNNNISIDEEDICFAFEDSPFAKFLSLAQ